MSNPSQQQQNSTYISFSSNNNVVKQIFSKDIPIQECNKNLVYSNWEYAKMYPDKVLGIKNVQEFVSELRIVVIYNCDKSATPLSKVKYSTSRQKFRLFKNLIEILFFLKEKNILHRNLKPSNIILYNDKLYLTDFGHQKNNPHIDSVNFLERKNDSKHKRNLYPYLSSELVNLIYEDRRIQDVLKAIKERDENSVKLQDQYAIGVMMLEIFSPFADNQKLSEIKTCKQLLETRKEHINKITLDFDFPQEGVEFLKQTISDILDNKHLSEKDIEKQINNIELQIIDFHIKKQDLMIQDNQNQVDNILSIYDDKLDFDLNFLYYFDLEQLNNLFLKVKQNIKLKEEIKRIINLQKNIQNLNEIESSQTEQQFNQMKKEDLFISLVHLDQNIEKLRQDKDQEKLKKNLEIKKKLMKYYIQINQTPQKEFLFNNIKIYQQKESNIDVQQSLNVVEQQPVEEKINDSIQQDPPQINVQPYQAEVILNQEIRIEEQNQEIPSQVSLLQNPQSLNNQPQGENDILMKVCIYKLPSNEQDFQLDLQQQIENNFENPTLKLYFKINKLFSFNHSQTKQELNIYKRKNDNNPEYIYIGKIIDSIFYGEIIKIEDTRIFHYINVDQNFNTPKIQKSLIYQYKCIEGPEKFKKIKQYIGSINQGKYQKGEEIDYSQNIIFKGLWENNQQTGVGSKQLFDTEFIQKDEPYKWEGVFVNKVADGPNIKTYLYQYDKNVQIYLEGQQINGKKVGLHNYYRIQNKQNNVQAEPVLFKSVYFFNLGNKEIQIRKSCF